ncbi:relaxase/mobilization nuclease domain-containing protein, partial [Lactobacillus rhamnosus]|nr:relaxase/mobilization nuclease domain-containing protein [Lacticaseibacillus rhamnosus]
MKIFRYVTENTFDSYSWQLIENKQKFIGQIMTSKSPVRSCDDVDEAALSYAEVKALATGNPYIKEKMTLDTEVAKLKLLKANFKSQKYRLEDAINKEYPVRIAKLEEKIEGLRQDIITRGPEEILSDGFEIRINGVPYDDKKEGGAALIAAAKESKTPERTMIGDYKGFKLYSRFDAFFNLYYIHMQGRCEHTIEMSSDPAGMITRLNNCMAGFEKRLSDAQDALDETRIELETAEQAHRNAVELAKNTEAWKGHEVLIATHIDRGHIHSHFIVNSVNYENGYKLQWSKADLQNLKDRCN